MGFFDKFKFWHKEETGLGDLDLGLGTETTPATPTPTKGIPTFEQSMAMQSPTQLQSPLSVDQHRSYNLEQELKLISSKLDTLIAKMDNMNQRIANLERIAEEAQK
ncbi:hypothetical protein DRJ48_05060 [Candidatus Woesearchaeota archaeon]|nr:hypothetical protein [Candidatus Woesearchaeota archaeon]RLE41693.1 MAG: hypothetical protein DRJ48_05060 [Candidatus Woesearchaeota archaeon]